MTADEDRHSSAESSDVGADDSPDGADDSSGRGAPESTATESAAVGENAGRESTEGRSAESASDRFGGPDDGPAPVRTGSSDEGIVTKLRTAKTGPWFVVREVLTSLVAVAVVGLVLFSVSGVWPPMVAVESGSMEPHMHKGDLVFITEPTRFTPDGAYGDTGVVTARSGSELDYRSFGGYGSVVVYDDPGRGGPPIIHRAHFYVDAGENWYDEANPDYVGAASCEELLHCPAPHAGFITKGDANGRYDQASGIAPPVRPAWVTGIARLRIPYLGWVRLGIASGVGAMPPSDATADSSVGVNAGVDDAESERRTLDRPTPVASTANTTGARAGASPVLRTAG